MNSCVGSEVLTEVVVKIYSFWDMTPCCLDTCFHSGFLLCSWFYPEDGYVMVLRKVD
jgi:hypothetical protein